MKISGLMKHDVATVSEDATLQAAARLMWEKDCGAVPVVDEDGRLHGMLTDRDVAMAAFTRGKALDLIKVKDTMSAEVFWVLEDQDLAHALQVMRDHQVRRLPVLDKRKRLAGIISLNDLAIEQHRSQGRSLKADLLAETFAAICAHRKAGATIAA